MFCEVITRRGLWVFILLAFAATPVRGQLCTGDCDSSGSVSVDELVIGLNIALGVGEPNDCPAFAGSVTIDELVEGVQNALQGCPSSRFVRASSSVALSSIFVMSFGSLGSSSATGAQALARPIGPSPPAAVGGGTGLPCDTLFCPFGGTEVRCCDLDGLTFEWSQCILSDGTEVNGSYRVESLDEDPCFFGLPLEASAALPPPPGIHFFVTFEGYSIAAGDFLGNFTVFAGDFVEEFEPFGAECGLIAPEERLLDPLGFAVRGDGTRYLQGSVRTIQGSGPQILQDIGTTFGTISSVVEVDVIIDDFSEISCLVDTQIDGILSSTNLLTGRDFTETYEEFIVLEAADFDGSYLIDLEGTSTTDCLGRVDIITYEPLKIFPDGLCPVGGELGLDIVDQGSSSIVSYTEFGGVEYDFDSDGSIDDARSTCVDLSTGECGVQQMQEICTACTEPSECGSVLVCAPCFFCEETAPANRCAPRDDFAVCDDGIFGELFIDVE